MREISKEEFKKSIIENVKNQYRRTIDEATPVSYTHLRAHET